MALLHFKSEAGEMLTTVELLKEALSGPGGFGGVTYRGHPLFDVYLNLDRHDMFGDEDGQGSYLGYDPDCDVFISGWDISGGG